MDSQVFKPTKERVFNFPYILYVGSERPRKNLGRLFEAFSKVKKDFPELKIVKVGGECRKFRILSLLKIKELNLEKDIIFTGNVKDKDLPKYYSGALLFIYPSLYEGFGLPILEAMSCGCPVLASNITSIPEVVGDAGILFNPYNVENITETMERLIEDKKVRKN